MMKSIVQIGFVMVFIALVTTGCWNLEEPDQRAFVMGTGMDMNKDGKYLLSTLIAIPSGIGVQEGGSSQKSFQVLSATGRNNTDAAQKLQAQLSRTLFIGHREIVLIGEKMAEHGIADWIDEYFRNPQSEARSKIFVVKGTQAMNVFKINSMFDPYITSTLYDEQATLGLRNFYFAAFMYDALGQGTQPLLPVLTMNPRKHYVYSGFAVLNKDNGLKLAAYLNPEESFYTNWVRRRINNYFMTATVPEFGGTISIKLRSLNRVGIMGIGRFCEIAGPIMVLTLIVGFSLNIVDIKWHYILPIITDFGVLPIMKHSIQTASFLGESLIFFSILPFLEHPRQAYSKSLIAVGLTAVLACLATTLVLLVFGPDVSARMRFPYFMLVRSINLLDFIQNMDIFVIFIWVFGLFARISLYLFITSYEAARWFRVKNWRSFIWFGAPSMFIMALLIPNEAILKSVNLYWQTIAFPICSIGIPLLLLLVSAFRKKKTVQT